MGDVLDTRAYRDIVSYDPSELVITVRCGTPMAGLEAALYGFFSLQVCANRSSIRHCQSKPRQLDLLNALSKITQSTE
jgi:hypothetical protein